MQVTALPNPPLWPVRAAIAMLVSLAGVACSDDPAAGGASPAATHGARYVLNTVVSDTESSLSYVGLLDSLDGQKQIVLDDAREFSGSADTWVYDGSIFVAESETLTITKYSVERSELVEESKISFADYGLTDFGFWVNTFISPSQAFLMNGTSEYVIWNPTTMEIRKTLPLPELEERDGLRPIAGYTDRAAVVRDGRLYHPIYWSDEDIITFSANSQIAVVDLETEEIELLDAPCPGLDYATTDDSGTMYFSSWIFAPGGAALHDQPPTCVVKLAAGSDAKPTVAFNLRDVTHGRDGGVFRYVGNGKAVLSALHPEHAEGKTDDPADIKYGDNWRFWSYDLEAGTASELDTIEWNAGVAYAADVDGKALTLVATADYANTAVYDLNEGDPHKLFDVRGWAMRLFALDP